VDKEGSDKRLLFVESVSAEKVKKNRTTLAVSIVLIGLGFAAVIFLRREIWAKLPTKIKNAMLYVKSLFFWNGIIRSAIELFFPTILSNLTAIKAHSNDVSKMIMPTIQLIGFICFLVYTFLHIEYHKEMVDKAEYKVKFGAFFTNVETYGKPAAYHYSTFFLLRRLVIAISLVCLS